MTPYQNILVYLDSNDSSLVAAMYGILLAKEAKCDITVMYVVDTKALSYLVKSRIFLDEEHDNYEKDLMTDANRYLNQVEKMATRKGVKLRVESDRGSAVSCVNSYIRKENIDLLIMGSVSKIQSRREELASDEDRLLRMVGCPVLIVRDDERIWEEFEEDLL